MSTIPETMVASTLGMECFAIALVTNLAAGLTSKELTHQEVSEVGKKSAALFTNFMKGFLGKIHNSPILIPDSSISVTPKYQGHLPLVNFLLLF